MGEKHGQSDGKLSVTSTLRAGSDPTAGQIPHCFKNPVPTAAVETVLDP